MAEGFFYRGVQIGASADPTKNFVFEVPPVQDGTARIVRGDGTHVVDIAADGKVSFPGNVQTWQDVTGSRAIGNTYTNTTGQPIDIAVSISNGNNVNSYGSSFSVGGVVVSTQYALQTGTAPNNLTMTFTLRIPAGVTYGTSGASNCSLTKWMELR